MTEQEIAESVEIYLKQHPKEEIELRSFIKEELTESNWQLPQKTVAILRKRTIFDITVFSQFGTVHPLYIVKLKKKWWHHWRHDIILAVITALLSLIVGWLLLQPDKKESELKNRLQDETLIRHSDSLKILTNALNDSLKAIRADMKK